MIDNEKLKRILCDKNKIKEELYKIQREHWVKLEPFNGNPDNVPELPVWEDYKEFCVPILIRCGAIPKNELVVGAKYLGTCRNSDTAIWTGTKFEYKRYKFGTYYTDSVNHFEDDDGYDLFVPVKLIE